VAAASALLQRVRAVGSPLEYIVDDMTKQVTDLIGMTLQVHKALPRQPNSNQVAVDKYTMPANFRRGLKSLRHAPPICYNLPLDTSCNYGVSVHTYELGLRGQGDEGLVEANLLSHGAHGGLKG
jgi:hypothetical protein